MPHTPRTFILLAILLVFLPACHATIRQPPAGASAYADIPSGDLRDNLADMARAHDQKVQLAFYVSLPWVGVDAPFRDFYTHMSEQQRDLGTQLRAWAKKHNIDLAFNFSDDTAGRAQKIMEARQEKVVRGDARPDFERDTLMQMSTDYEWQISLAQALLPKVHDEGLRAYLQKSLKIHEAGSAEITGLLKKFQASTK